MIHMKHHQNQEDFFPLHEWICNFVGYNNNNIQYFTFFHCCLQLMTWDWGRLWPWFHWCWNRNNWNQRRTRRRKTSGEAGRSSSKRVRHIEQGMFDHHYHYVLESQINVNGFPIDYGLWAYPLAWIVEYWIIMPEDPVPNPSWFHLIFTCTFYITHVFIVIKSRATLIICPASLIHHWHKEIERRVKGKKLQVLMYHGQNREKDILRYKEKYDY